MSRAEAISDRASAELVVERVPIASGDARSELVVVPAAARAMATVVCLPAMGTPAGFYEPLARALAQRGFDVVVAELRGVGSSSVRATRGIDFGFQDLIDGEITAALAYARSRFRAAPLHVVGHSLGGQLAALHRAEHGASFDRLALVASGSVDYRGYRERAARVLFGTQLARGIAHVLGFFPGERLGFGGRQPISVIDDWARVALTGSYRPRGARIDHERALGAIELDVLALVVRGDQLAPRSAMDRLCAKMPGARVVRREIALSHEALRGGDPHFRWVRAPEPAADEIARFLAA